MRDEMLGVEARALDRALFEIGGGRLQDFEDGHLSQSCHPEAARDVADYFGRHFVKTASPVVCEIPLRPAADRDDRKRRVVTR